jgi:Sulfotransferase domain
MAENGLRLITEIAPTDIVVCGFPRSGHTWFQNLLAGIVFGVDPEVTHDSLIQDLVPDVHYKRFYKRYPPLTCFKSHALPVPEYRRVVYLLRDGRDAMVSYYHFLRALYGPIDFVRFAQGEGVSPCEWHEHVERWSANPHRADMIIVRYEDLQTATLRELRRFCAFAGLERDNAYLVRIASHAAFTKAKAKERRLGWDNAAWPRDQPFIRRGQIGSWRDEMPPAVLAALLKKAGATLNRFGYS